MESKCLCVKNYYLRSPVNEAHFIKGKYYKYTDQQFVTRDYPEGYNVSFSKGEYIYFRKHQDPLAEKGFGLFNTYFRTIKEQRKEKIEKLNEKIKM